MNFSKMEVTDLLSQESFLNYCKRSSPADIAFWENYILEDPQCRVTVEYAKAQFVTLFNELAAADLDAQVLNLENNIRNNEAAAPVNGTGNVQGRKIRFSRVYKMAAAAILIAVGYLVLTYPGNRKIEGAKTFLAT